MAGSMLDSILALVTPEMKQSLAARLGESPQSVQTGLGTAAAATLAGCARKAGDTSFLGRILNMASDASGQNLMGNLSSLASSGPSGATADLVNEFLPMVLGGNLDKVSGLLSQKAGVSSASMSGLLRMAVPLIIGFLGKLNSSGSLSLGSLAGMLRSEAPNLEKYVPANLFSGRGQTTSWAASDVAGRLGLKKSALWFVLLGVLGAILLSWLVYRALNAGNGNAGSRQCGLDGGPCSEFGLGSTGRTLQGQIARRHGAGRSAPRSGEQADSIYPRPSVQREHGDLV